MMPPLVIDRSKLIHARVVAILVSIGKARTKLTVEAAVAKAEQDEEIQQADMLKILVRAETKMRALALSDPMVVGKGG